MVYSAAIRAAFITPVVASLVGFLILFPARLGRRDFPFVPVVIGRLALHRRFGDWSLPYRVGRAAAFGRYHLRLAGAFVSGFRVGNRRSARLGMRRCRRLVSRSGLGRPGWRPGFRCGRALRFGALG